LYFDVRKSSLKGVHHEGLLAGRMAMSKDHNKVVSLASVGQGVRRQGAVSRGSLPPPLAAVRDRVQTFLRVGLSELFDNADDTLFAKADRAASNADQSMFFDAMRLLRLQRHAVEKSCCEGLDRQFNELHGYRRDAAAPASYDLDSLRLEQPDELEQTVAMDSMVGRVLARNEQALTHLTLRLNALGNGGISDADNVLGPAQRGQLLVDGYETVAMDSMVGRVLARNQQALTHLTLRLNALVNGGISDADNVLAPAQLVQLFVDGYAPLNLDIKVRLIILKMFERHVFNSLDSLY